jgi:hypothetical protein
LRYRADIYESGAVALYADIPFYFEIQSSTGTPDAVVKSHSLSKEQHEEMQLKSGTHHITFDHEKDKFIYTPKSEEELK